MSKQARHSKKNAGPMNTFTLNLMSKILYALKPAVIVKTVETNNEARAATNLNGKAM